MESTPHNNQHTRHRLPFLMPEDFDEMHLVAWRVEPGQPDENNPLLEPEMPWDAGCVFSHGTVLHDPLDGLWKTWQISTPPSEIQTGGRKTNERRLTYLESDDGVTWKRPELSFVPWEGFDRTNILLDFDSGGKSAYASVSIDPSNREWPYEMFLFREPSYENPSGRIRGLALPPGTEQHPYGLYRYRSRDGQAWEPVDGPLALATEDSCFIYHQPNGSYVAYHKTEIPVFPGGMTPYDIADGSLRLIGRRTSPDGTTWSDPTEIVLAPDWRDPADTQFMELCPLAVPGGYVATLTVYHNLTQTIDLQLAASHNGIHWWRPDRRAALPNPPLGDYGGGMIWPMRTPVEMKGHIHVYYGGLEGIHGDIFDTRTSGPRRLRAHGEVISRQSSSLPFHGALCRATWRSDRLWALVSAAGGPTVGSATTTPQQCGGKRLLVNILTRSRGCLQVELLDDTGVVIPGFSRDDCTPLDGDYHDAWVHWNGSTRAPSNATQIRFYLRRVNLYGFDWRN